MTAINLPPAPDIPPYWLPLLDAASILRNRGFQAHAERVEEAIAALSAITADRQERADPDYTMQDALAFLITVVDQYLAAPLTKRADAVGRLVNVRNRVRCVLDAAAGDRQERDGDAGAVEGARDAALEEVAAMLDQKADNYAHTYGHVDWETGALEFGTGPRAQAREDRYNDLRELADEVRAMKAVASVQGTPAPQPLNGIAATWAHDEGAYAQCNDCGRYSLDPNAMRTAIHACECGSTTGWCGSFKRPGADAKWSGTAPAGVAPTQGGDDGR